MGANGLADQAALTEPARIRAFFGLPVPEPQREELAAYVQRCAALAPDFRWGSENVHLTVRFVGPVERDVIEGVADRLEGGAGPAFELGLGGTGTFQRGRLARVVWLGVALGIEAVTSLARRVDRECRDAGLEGDDRPFRPHLTLARARAREGAVLPAIPPAPRLEPWVARELVLYSSRPGPGGAVHEPIRTVRLLE